MVAVVVRALVVAHYVCMLPLCLFFFIDTAPTDIYTLSLHDALPIYANAIWLPAAYSCRPAPAAKRSSAARVDRKSTRLNSSHLGISYAVFCLKKKKNAHKTYNEQRKTTPHVRAKSVTTKT